MLGARSDELASKLAPAAAALDGLESESVTKAREQLQKYVESLQEMIALIGDPNAEIKMAQRNALLELQAHLTELNDKEAGRFASTIARLIGQMHRLTDAERERQRLTQIQDQQRESLQSLIDTTRFEIALVGESNQARSVEMALRSARIAGAQLESAELENLISTLRELLVTQQELNNVERARQSFESVIQRYEQEADVLRIAAASSRDYRKALEEETEVMRLRNELRALGITLLDEEEQAVRNAIQTAQDLRHVHEETFDVTKALQKVGEDAFRGLADQLEHVRAQRDLVCLRDAELVAVEVVAAVVAAEVFGRGERQPLDQAAVGPVDLDRRLQDRAVQPVAGRLAAEVADFGVQEHRLSLAELVALEPLVVAVAGDLVAEVDVAKLEPGVLLQPLDGAPQLGDRLGGAVAELGDRIVVEVVGQRPEHLLPELLVGRFQPGDRLQRPFVLAGHQVQHPQVHLAFDVPLPLEFAALGAGPQFGRFGLGAGDQLLQVRTPAGRASDRRELAGRIGLRPVEAVIHAARRFIPGTILALFPRCGVPEQPVSIGCEISVFISMISPRLACFGTLISARAMIIPPPDRRRASPRHARGRSRTNRRSSRRWR
jgi:hypothetical protein